MEEQKMITLSESCRIDLENIISIILHEYNYKEGVKQIDVSMFPDITQKEILNALGEGYWQGKLNLGYSDSEKAISFFTRSNNLERLTQIGNELLSKLQLRMAEEAFRAAGRKITAAQYNIVGGIRVEKGKYYDAIEPYSKAKNNSALIKLGKLCIKKGHLVWAKCAFEAAGKKMTKAQYRHIGDVSLQRGEEHDALSAYEQAGYGAGMCKVGRIYIKQGDLESAQEAYRKAKRKLRLSQKQFCRIGDINLKKREYNNAVEAYKAAGRKDKLLRMAQTLVRKMDFDYFYNAKLAYREAGQPFPREEALHIAEKEFKVGNMDIAKETYGLVGDKVMVSFIKQFRPEDKDDEKEEDNEE